MSRRQSGLGVPLFSLASRHSWGIGEFADLAHVFALAAGGGAVAAADPADQRDAAGRASPYSAMTAMALDPIYISLPDVADFAGLGGELALDDAELAALAPAPAPRIPYGRCAG